MASAFYPKGLEAFGNAGINWGSDTIKACLVDTATYTYNVTHQFRSSLTGVAGGTHPTLGSKTNVGGVLDAADITFAAVTAGASVEAAVFYKDTGNAATDVLILYDEFATFTPNGGDLLLTLALTGLCTL